MRTSRNTVFGHPAGATGFNPYTGVTTLSSPADAPESAVTLRDDSEATIRMLRKEDAGLKREFIRMRGLINVARRRGIRSTFSIDANENECIRELARDLGCKCERDPDDATR